MRKTKKKLPKVKPGPPVDVAQIPEGHDWVNDKLVTAPTPAPSPTKGVYDITVNHRVDSYSGDVYLHTIISRRLP